MMKGIPGYENLYAVDEDGVVFSYRMNDILVPVWKAPTGKIQRLFRSFIRNSKNKNHEIC